MKRTFLLLLFMGPLAALLFHTSPLQAQSLSGTWSGALHTGALPLHIVFHFSQDTLGKNVCLMDSPDQGTKDLPAEVLFLGADSVSIALPRLEVTFQGAVHNGVIEGTFVQRGNVLPLRLEQKELIYHRPQTPQPPYPYTTEEVTFTNELAGVTLAGTLTYPIGYCAADKVPVVLMVSGSGLQNRDSEMFQHRPFLVLAHYLAQKGIASLRYDDRAVGESLAAYPAKNTEEVAQDAAAGIAYLRQRALFSKVGLIGHSEGGCVAFMLSAQGLLDFAVSMAGVGTSGEECLYEQAVKISQMSGLPFTSTKDQYIDYILLADNPWIEYFVDYQGTTYLPQITCPLFALNGTLDTQVMAAPNLQTIRAYLPPNPLSCIKEYPGLNHLFQECATGLPAEYGTIEQTLSPTVLSDIAAWILQLP